jgi:Fe-S cluster assembly ATP-binding protein
MSTLEIKGLCAEVGGNEILKGIDLAVSSGEVHAVMGPNGAGKSTLSAVVMGKPGYTVTAGSVTLDGADVLAMPPWQRAAAGLHLVMQYPTEVPGVLLDDVLAEALATRGRCPKRVGGMPRHLMYRSIRRNNSMASSESPFALCSIIGGDFLLV